MQDLLELMQTRRSVRKYKPDPVPKEQIEAIIQAGLYAPSARGLQSTAIVAITDKAFRDKLAEENRKIGGWEPGFDPFYGAPVILLVIGKASVPNAIYDGAAALTNMANAAHALGLAGCWIHRAKEEMAGELGQEIASRLGLTEEYIGIGHLALGYADGQLPTPAPRQDGRSYYID